MDEEGYPTEETLEKIKNWDPNDFNGLAVFIYNLWIYGNYSNYYPDISLALSTGGWSGHEDIINSIPKEWINNFLIQSESGGHFIFMRKDILCSPANPE